MKKKVLMAALAATVSLSMLAPTVVLAEDNTGVIESNSNDYDENSGTIAENHGTIDNNSGTDNPSTDEFEGGIKKNMSDGTVNTNNGTIRENFGSVGENNNYIGAIDEGGTLSNNKSTGEVAFVNIGGVVSENNGEVGCNMGKVETNKGTVIDNRVNPTQTGNVKGTIDNNASGATVKENSGAIITLNNGTVETNRDGGVVTNGDNGIILINRSGGVVNGTGTVKKNLGLNSVAETVNVLQQYFGITSEKYGHLAFTEQANEDTYQYLNDDTTWLLTTGTAEIKPADAQKKITKITVSGGNGATITQDENGKFFISGITKDVVLLVSFEGDPEPKPVVVHKDDVKEDKTEDKKNEVEVPAIATQTVFATAMPAVLPTTADATVQRLAPVLGFNATYVAVDLNGQPIAVNVVRDHSGASDKAFVDVISNALTANGITATRVFASYTGTITSSYKNSVMTLQALTSRGATIYVVFKNPVTGETTYVTPKINADGTISFGVPFANCQFSVVEVEK